jgi:hypothetical protein
MNNVVRFAGVPSASNTAAEQPDFVWDRPQQLPESLTRFLGLVPQFRREDPERADPMADSDDLIDAKIARAEAQTETKILRLEGRFENIATSINAKLDSLIGQVGEQRRDRNLIIGTIVVSALTLFAALAGLTVGMATYGDALFGRGMNVRDVVLTVFKEQQQAQERVQQAPQNKTNSR